MHATSSPSGFIVQRTWGGSGFDNASGVVVDSSGNIYVSGTTNSFGPGSPSQSAIVLLKYDPRGSLLWQRIWSGTGNGNDTSTGVATDSSGSVYVTGYTTSFGAGKEDVLLLKFGPSGSLVWQRTWSGSQTDKGDSVAVDSSGNIYVSGHTDRFGTGAFEVLLLRFDTSGNLIWQRTWGVSGFEAQGLSVAVDSSGAIFVAGEVALLSKPENPKGLLLKFGSSGSLLLQENWYGSAADVGQGIAIDPSGSIYIAGFTLVPKLLPPQVSVTGSNVAILKLNSTGGPLWEKSWGGLASTDGGLGVASDSSGNIYVTGITRNIDYSGPAPNFLGENAFLLRFDSSGGLISSFTYGGFPCTGCTRDRGEAVAVNSFGGPVVVGQVGEHQEGVGDCPVPSSNARDCRPYALKVDSISRLGTSSFGFGSLTGTLAAPMIGLMIPTGSISTPPGTQNYGGSTDIFLLEATQLYGVTIRTNPPGSQVGSIGITFNDTYYEDGENGVYPEMVAPVTAPAFPGYSFSHWALDGGLSAASDIANPTSVTIHGPGSLLAVFAPTKAAQFPLQGLLPFLGITAASGIILALSIFAIVKRSRKSQAQPTMHPSLDRTTL